MKIFSMSSDPLLELLRLLEIINLPLCHYERKGIRIKVSPLHVSTLAIFSCHGGFMIISLVCKCLPCLTTRWFARFLLITYFSQ